MPIYEYKCLSCDGHFEKIQKTSDEPIRECENCGGKLQKQWSLSGFQFKGEGWYVTDYAKKNGSKSEGKDSSEKSSSESTEKSKPASKDKAAVSDKKEKAPKKT